MSKRPRSRAGRYALLAAVILAVGGAPFAIAQTGGIGRFTSDDDRYTLFVRNTRAGDGGAAAMTCNSDTGSGREPCMSMVNKGTGFAAAFRTRGLTGFRLQTSGSGTATPFLLDANAEGKVDHLNADLLDGKDSAEVGREAWAFVDGDGSPAFIRENGAASVTRVEAGLFRVTFDTDVNNCTYQVTPADPAKSNTVAALATSGDNKSVDVSIRNASDQTGPNARQNADFQIAVHC